MHSETPSPGLHTVERTFAIVQAIRELDGAGVTELATHLDIAKSSVHKHLATLREHGFVVAHGDTYHVGLQFMDYGDYAQHRYELYELAEPSLAELAEETGERVWCVVEENGLGWYLRGASGKHSTRSPVRTGTRPRWTHLHTTAAGKAILAYLPEERVHEIVDRFGLPAKTEHTITDREALFEELATVRERGIAFNVQESIRGIRAVGAPIRDVDTREVYGAISVSGPANRLTTETCDDEIVALLRGTTNELEVNLSVS